MMTKDEIDYKLAAYAVSPIHKSFCFCKFSIKMHCYRTQRLIYIKKTVYF